MNESYKQCSTLILYYFDLQSPKHVKSSQNNDTFNHVYHDHHMIIYFYFFDHHLESQFEIHRFTQKRNGDHKYSQSLGVTDSFSSNEPKYHRKRKKKFRIRRDFFCFSKIEKLIGFRVFRTSIFSIFRIFSIFKFSIAKNEGGFRHFKKQ